MKVKCFGCDALIEADAADDVVDAFVAHGQQNHTWSYPEEAIRDYARNYVEATERLTGGTERLPEIGGITIHPVTRDRIDDWLNLFDHDAFAGNPDWASCYCLEPHVPATPEQPERVWRETRAIEGYPLNKPQESDAGHFRGPRSMYDARGFEPIKVRERDTLVRMATKRA